MNKLLLISLVIFFTICSRSWAESMINEKGIVCTGGLYLASVTHTKIFYFENDNVYEYKLTKNLKIERTIETDFLFNVIISIQKDYYTWVIPHSRTSYHQYNLNRKTLKLEAFYMHKGEKRIDHGPRSCEVYNSLNILIKEYFEPIIKEKEGKQDKDNKI